MHLHNEFKINTNTSYVMTFTYSIMTPKNFQHTLTKYITEMLKAQEETLFLSPF